MSRNDSGVGLYARRLRRTGATLTTEQALLATGLRTRAGQVKAIEDMRAAGLIECDDDVVKPMQQKHERPGRKPGASYDGKGRMNGVKPHHGHRFTNEREGWRDDVRNGPVHTRPLNGQELAALTDAEVAERLAAVAEITDEGEVFETGIKVAVAPEDESYE